LNNNVTAKPKPNSYTERVPEPIRLFHLIEKNRLNTGSAVQMLAAANGLGRRGHDVWVGSPVGGDLESACADSGLQFLDLPLRSPWDPASASRLRRHLRRHKTDILHVHKGRAHGIGLVAAIGMGRRPRLVVNRGVTFPLDVFNKWKYRHPRVSSVVCVADAVRDVVIHSGGLRPDSVLTIHGGTDPGVFSPGRIEGPTFRRELGIDPDHIVVGQVSVRGWKGWSDLVAAFALLAARSPAARLLFIGCEPESERKKVEEAVREAGLAGRVMTLSYRADMPDVLATCDVVVDASWAGTGITGVIREAMAMERSVIATDCGGNRELVIDGEVGLVVPPRDIDALAAALSRLINDPDLRRRLGTAGRRRVVEHFSAEKRIDRLEALYWRMLR
jgi:glycosyltransferase involved in cell wall biosynthesis